MAYLLGILLFAFAIVVSVCLHEAGHMLAAKSFGMKVTRYFAGFGPTVFSFRRGETEYGLKAIPLGGFVKIVGMTPQDDDVAPEDEPRAMWRFAVWKRTIVMLAGIGVNIALAFVFFWVLFAFVGVAKAPPPTIKVMPCVVVANENRECKPGTDPAGPAATAQLKDGDKVTAVNGTRVTDYLQLRDVLRKTKPGSVAQITYVRDGRTSTVPVQLATVQRAPMDNPTSSKTVPTAAMGIGANENGSKVTYGPIESVGKAGGAGVDMFGSVISSLKALPAGVVSLWDSLTGGERSLNTPVSVVGITDIGAQSVERGAWDQFLVLFISLNFFLGVFNLVPLLPLDGGHVAIAWFEKVRSWLYALLRRPDPGRVDYAKLMPVTLAVVVLLGGLFILSATADVINPIKMP